MTAYMAALLVGSGVLRWNGGSIRSMWWVLAGVATGLGWRPARGEWIATGILAVGIWAVSRPPKSKRRLRQRRRALVGFWRALSLYLTAGLTFWQAVDGALDQEPSVAADVRRLAWDLAHVRRDEQTLERFRRLNPGPEGEMISTLMLHGYRHGLTAEEALRQAGELEERLAFEEELARRSDPLWLTLLPAVLLLGVLALTAAPLFSLLVRNWVF